MSEDLSPHEQARVPSFPPSTRTRTPDLPFRPLQIVAVGALILMTLVLLFQSYRHKRQKRDIMHSAGSCNSVGIALEAYAVDHEGLLPPVADAIHPLMTHRTYRYATPRPIPSWPPATPVSALRSSLTPQYIIHLPLTDAWGNPLLFAISDDRRHFVVVSPGSDGTLERTVTYAWPMSETWRDIVFADGTFISLADGITH